MEVVGFAKENFGKHSILCCSSNTFTLRSRFRMVFGLPPTTAGVEETRESDTGFCSSRVTNKADTHLCPTLSPSSLRSVLATCYPLLCTAIRIPRAFISFVPFRAEAACSWPDILRTFE